MIVDQSVRHVPLWDGVAWTCLLCDWTSDSDSLAWSHYFFRPLPDDAQPSEPHGDDVPFWVRAS